MKKEDMDKVSKITDLWIDIGAANRAEALERIRVADPAVLDADVQELPNGRIVSRSIDNRIGAYVVAEVLRLLAKDRPKHAAVFAVATTREELAWTGGGARTSAVGPDPQVARSEERRVGKECRCRWWQYGNKRRRCVYTSE